MKHKLTLLATSCGLVALFCLFPGRSSLPPLPIFASAPHAPPALVGDLPELATPSPVSKRLVSRREIPDKSPLLLPPTLSFLPAYKGGSGYVFHLNVQSLFDSGLIDQWGVRDLAESITFDEWFFPAWALGIVDLRSVTLFAQCKDNFPSNLGIEEPVFAFETNDVSRVIDLSASLQRDRQGVMQRIRQHATLWDTGDPAELNTDIDEEGEYWLKLQPSPLDDDDINPLYGFEGNLGNQWISHSFRPRLENRPIHLGPYLLPMDAEIRLKGTGEGDFHWSLYRSHYSQPIQHKDWRLYSVRIPGFFGSTQSSVICGANTKVGLVAENLPELKNCLDHRFKRGRSEMTELMRSLDWSATAIFALNCPEFSWEDIMGKDVAEAVKGAERDLGWEPEFTRSIIKSVTSIESVAVEVFHSPYDLVAEITIDVPDAESGEYVIKFWEEFLLEMKRSGKLPKPQIEGVHEYVTHKIIYQLAPYVEGSNIRGSITLDRQRLASLLQKDR